MGEAWLKGHGARLWVICAKADASSEKARRVVDEHFSLFKLSIHNFTPATHSFWVVTIPRKW